MTDTPQFPGSVKGFPLLDALVGRRSRRFGLGMSIPDGPLAYTSAYEPIPLSEQERALLVFAAAGITGWNLGMPHTASGDSGAGANYPLRHVGRTAPSAAAIESSEVLVADDTGTFITQTRNAADDVIEAAANERSVEHLVELSVGLLEPLSAEPLRLPRLPPHMSAHNRWNGLVPGSTLLVPVVDMTEQLMDLLSIFTGEGVILWDPSQDVPIGDPSRLVQAGVLHDQARMPIADFEQIVHQQGTVEAGLMAYNAQLMLQAMGLGGWLYAGIDSATLLGAYAGQGVPGFGFDFATSSAAGPPNAVGRAAVFETLAQPYAADTTAAVERFVARKFGVGGLYETPSRGPYADNAAVKRSVQRYSDDTITYFVSVLDGLLARFGRYPGTVPTVLTSVYVQAQHIDADYYDTFHRPDPLLTTHREHMRTWHPGTPLRRR